MQRGGKELLGEDVSDRDNSEEFYDYNLLPLHFESAFIFRFSSNATNL